MKQAIEDYHEVLNRELDRLETRPNDPVFTSLSRIRSFGKRLSPNSVNVIVKDHVRMAGIKVRISAHSLRHSSATEALRNGASLRHVQRHLRHVDPRMTLRYDHDLDAENNPTIDLLPKLSE